MEQYKGFKIFEKGGKYTVGGDNNAEFDDCTLENITSGVDEHDMYVWNKQHGNNLSYEDIRGNKTVTEEDYLQHLSRYKTEENTDFADYELIVPIVTFTALDKAKEFIDWLITETRPIEEILNNIPELKEIDDTPFNVKIVSYKNWDNRIKAISEKNFNKYKKALTPASLGIYFNPCIICIRSDTEEFEINEEKYKLIRKYVTSETHHK